MYYHPALDGAPSSVSSTLVALVSSIVSVFGCVFMMVRLLDVCSVITTAAALASLVHNTQWTQKQHWIQTNMAPVFGIIIFLPLVNTIITQIVWRFRSSEFAYCWVPRMPIHARWIAVDGWRVLSVCSILVTYSYMAYTVFRAKRQCTHVLPNHSYSSSTFSQGRAPNMLHLSEIDSGVASVASGTRGLFSQSMHNIQYWALSKLGRSRGQTQGLRKEPQCPDTLSIAPSITRSYYTSFKRSLNTLARWFHITTDIPSPTISNIFDSMDYDRALSTTQCEFCSIRNSHEITISDSYCTDDLHVDMVSYFGMRPRGLRRWCSTLVQMVRKPSTLVQVPQLPLGTRLRRSHTAPVVLRQNMNLCNCVFKRPRDSCAQMCRSADHVCRDVSVCEPQTLTFVHPHDKHPMHNSALSGKVHEMFGHTLQPHMAEPRRVSIYTCANRHINESLSSYDNSAHMDKPLECNNWTHAVAHCRSAISNTQPRVSRLYVYPLAHALIYLPYIIYSIASTHVYFSTFSSLSLTKRHDMGGLPAQWTHSDNANRAWPYLQHARGSNSNTLYWLAVLQAVHLLNGGIDALLFWITESQ
ncbi:hypothetical protein GGH96_000354 [Coemansia sp. RSA 1972]|nr:hypothetical protein GGH96_000354 [Coemansia sp. RSA 1972]